VQYHGVSMGRLPAVVGSCPPGSGLVCICVDECTPGTVQRVPSPHPQTNQNRPPKPPPAGAVDAARRMVAAEGPLSLYRGLAPTLVGIAPYAAINFASYDLLKKRVYGGGGGGNGER
jgi:hypothetical protein